MITILYINNDGGGFANNIQIQAGTTVADFFRNQVGGVASAYLIRVNRQAVMSSYVLVEGDRVTVTPTKIEGAL